ncbi:MAG: AzlC family ABC transporter permease [Rhizobiaceae bacterium]
MDQTEEKSDFWEGVRETIPLMGAVIPFSLVFGATAVQNGYTVVEAVFASATIFAGASQFVFIEVNGLHVPGWSVILAVFAVNFRHILYSASLGRYMQKFSPARKIAAFFFMTDFHWASSETRIHTKGAARFTPSWYFGFTVPLYSMWVVCTVIGAVTGRMIRNPEAFGFDFLLPLYFLIILIGFRRRPNFLFVVCVSGTVSYLALRIFGEPWHISLGAITGVLSAALLPLKERSNSVLSSGQGEDV